MSMPIFLGLLILLFNYLFFDSKKSGEIKLREEEIIFIQNGKKQSFRFSGISKIRLMLFSKTYSFHRNWWPLKDETGPYESSELNFIQIKPKKGKTKFIRVYLDSRKTENDLLDFLHEKCSHYQVGLKVK
ncbi:hypothetical protein [Aquiflexum sp.]|uniref:hypothetical protein n=1 Tax=Aquiflexum sp. TaxID=1872584 RepID=UPI003593CF35